MYNSFEILSHEKSLKPKVLANLLRKIDQKEYNKL